jgi:PleD family two-component response regulator
MNEVMMQVKQLNCQVLEKDMNLFCRLVIGIPKGRLEEAIYKFKEIRNMEITKHNL